MQFGNLTKLINPFQVISLGLLVSVLALGIAVYLSLNTPRLGVSFKVSEGYGQRSHVWASIKGHPQDSVEIVGISEPYKDPVPITPFELLEEPDILGFTEFNRFFLAQSAITRILHQPEVELHLEDGSRITISVMKGSITDLPVLFWLQAFYCLSAFLIAVKIWAFRREKTEALLLMLIGASYALGGMATAVYSTRELVMDGTVFFILTVISHLGVYLFMAFLISLLCSYPSALFPGSFIPLTMVCLSLFSLYLNYMQWIDFYVLFIGFFIVLIALLIWQWRITRLSLLERAAIEWFLLSIGLSTGFFFTLVMLPSSMGHQPLLGSQGSMMVFVWLLFIGVTLGVVRYRLFDLGRWWFFAWLWFIGGAMVVILDLALIYIWSLPQTAALTVALAFVGWLYFPLRQWLWSKLIGHNTGSESDYLPMIIEGFLCSRKEEDMLQSWPNLMQQVFSPLSLTCLDGEVQHATISQNGIYLEVPGLNKQQKLRLEYASQGSRLFSEQDRKLAQSLSVLVQQSWQVAHARKQGIYQERERINRELHDGLGAKLQAILHGKKDSETVTPIAREAWHELRGIISALEGTERLLSEMVGVWRADIKRVVDTLQLNLEWTVRLGVEIELPPLTTLHLGRILSEGVQNAVRHAEPSRISVAISQVDDGLEVLLENDGVVDSNEDWIMGRGMHNIRYRANELDGLVEWKSSEPGQVALLVKIPLLA